MKVLKLLFLSSVFALSISAQNTSIPDSNFEQALIDLGYDTGSPNGVVPTANIQNVQILNVSGKNIVDLTGIEDFTALKELYVFNNKLASLNVTNNLLLTHLYCYRNFLTSLDVTKNTALTHLDCGNQFHPTKDSYGVCIDNCNCFTSIDLSKNIDLIYFRAAYNCLWNVEFTNNTKLTHIDCSFNSGFISAYDKNVCLEHLNINFTKAGPIDLTKNNKLKRLFCVAAKTTHIDLRNGANHLIDSLALENTNLFCVAVDNPISSTINWVGNAYTKYSYTEYTDELCTGNVFRGNIFHDLNDNCINDSENSILPSPIVIATASNHTLRTIPNSNGDYELLVGINKNYNLDIVPRTNSTLVNGTCPSGGYNINSGTIGKETNNLNFGVDIDDCSLLKINYRHGRMRRCFESDGYISLVNEGPKTADNIEILIQFPEYLSLISASESYTVVDADNKIYKFDITSLSGFGAKSIRVRSIVSCDNEEIRGYTQCIKTWTNKKGDCAEIKDTTNWDKSSISIDDVATCINNEYARFVIRNVGEDMVSYHDYRVYLDNALAHTGTFKLNAGDSLIIHVPADGSTIRLEADQHPKHPGYSRPRTTIEGCGSPTAATASLGFWTEAPNDDLDQDVSIVCLEIIDSYDPNDKRVFPYGITENNYVPENEPLNYVIRFQNTGTDVAYNVIIKDTISEHLDLTTFRITASSHDYIFELKGENTSVAYFKFPNINLPDSTSNEPESHGFIAFSINPIENITPKTLVENFADIYFDFNSPIRTDTAFVTFFDTTAVSTKNITIIEGNLSTLNNQLSNVKIYPNPTKDLINIKSVEGFLEIKISDVTGKIVYSEKLFGNQTISLKELNSGLYFLKISDEKDSNLNVKIIKE
jgi:uncharacterized repeat protein (TIGR01451 family)